jgi:hypothetical protein
MSLRIVGPCRQTVTRCLHPRQTADEAMALIEQLEAQGWHMDYAEEQEPDGATGELLYTVSGYRRECACHPLPRRAAKETR